MARCPALPLVLSLLLGCAAQPNSHAASTASGPAGACLSRLDALSAPLAALQRQLGALGDQLQRALPATPSSCPQYWTRRGDSCYLIPSFRSSWFAAHHACAQLDTRARLASVHHDNAGHVGEVTSAAQTVPTAVWVGLVRVSSRPSVFGWTDGSAMDLSNWAPGEPNKESDACVQLYGARHPTERRFKWNDHTCSKEFYFLCQIKLVHG